MSQNNQTNPDSIEKAEKKGFGRGCLDSLYKNALLIILVLVVG